MQMQAGFMIASGNNQLNQAAYHSRGGADFLGGAIHLGEHHTGAPQYNDYMAGIGLGFQPGMDQGPNDQFNPFAIAEQPFMGVNLNNPMGIDLQNPMGINIQNPMGMIGLGNPMDNQMNNGGMHPQPGMGYSPDTSYNHFAAPDINTNYEQQPINPYSGQGGFGNYDQGGMPQGFMNGQMGVGGMNPYNQGDNQWNMMGNYQGQQPGMENWYGAPQQGGWEMQNQMQPPVNENSKKSSGKGRKKQK